MRLPVLAPALLAAGAFVSTAAAQGVVRAAPVVVTQTTPRAAIGVTTSSSSSSHDTLGVLVSSVRTDGPADKAGIVEGNRIASINGVSLKLSPSDIGDDEMANVMTRRLNRELERLHPGDDVDLRVYADGQAKSVKVKAVSSEDLYMSPERRRALDRPTLGINLAVTGTARDTLGVFVLSVDDNGPAAKAGVVEGSRIATINGVDVRGRAPDSDDVFILRTAGTSRLEHEISRLKPGDDVTLRVYYNGQYREVKTKIARAGDLPRRNRSIMISGDGSFSDAWPDIDGNSVRVGAAVRDAMETARAATNDAMIGFGRGMGVGFGRLNRTVVW